MSTNLDLRSIANQALYNWSSFSTTNVTKLWYLISSLQAQPNSVGFKVADKEELFDTVSAYMELGDMCHIGSVNDRLIATIRKPRPIAEGYPELFNLKILQRRPGSADALGLDHLDLLIKSGFDLKELERRFRELDVQAEVQRNPAHAWLSILHKGFEFKLVDHDVWDVCIAEMQT